MVLAIAADLIGDRLSLSRVTDRLATNSLSVFLAFLFCGIKLSGNYLFNTMGSVVAIIPPGPAGKGHKKDDYTYQHKL
jgi:hypothetical protein